MGEKVHGLRVGSLVVAKRACPVFGFGEVGVCYEAYRIGDRPGWSVVFERGGHDGFSPEDVALCLHVTGQVAPELAAYEFDDAAQVREDCGNGRFAAAFARARVGRGGRA